MVNRTFFNAHHSPQGAFASFTLGFKGASGGLGQELAGPANQNVYIGLQARNADFYEMLPFYGTAVNDRERFENSSKNNNNKQRTVPFAEHEIERIFGLGSDIWTAKDLTFKIFSPVMSLPDPETASSEALKRACIPAVFVEITVDNREYDSERSAVFGFQGTDPYSSMRHIYGNSSDDLMGIGQGLLYAICTNDKGVCSGLAFSIDEIIFPKRKEQRSFGLGSVGGIVCTTPAHEKKTWKFVICFYRGGEVTSGISSRYFYTQYFSSIEDVAAYGCLHFDYYRERAVISDKMITSSGLTPDRIFSICHAIRSYYGSTQFLLIENKPCWIVNEGEYRMINTFDLTVDHLFYEMRMNPWTVKNVLDMYIEKYCYYDNIGLSFTHDMGAGNVFSPLRRSAYEIGGLSGCFSFMTHEQLVNWVVCAAVYIAKTNDGGWLTKQKQIVADCLSSLCNRDHHVHSERDGVMDVDSSKVDGGEEITTYDNVDSSLGRARRNTYLAVKTWAAYLGLEYMLRKLSLEESAETALNQAARCADTICKYVSAEGFLPALLEENNSSVLIPVIEGLVFPYFFNKDLLAADGPSGRLLAVLRNHCTAVLKKGTCIFDDNGWKLSSTSNNSWLSKIYLCQFVAEKILGLQQDIEADKAHVNWLLDEENSYFAWSDQMMSGKVCGSRYYPRGVSSVLWLK